MKIEQLYTGCLAEAAYYIESNGEVAIIDPLREVDQYIQMATENGAKITYVLETHFHADFVSGHLDLAKKTGATIVFGPTAEPNFEAHIATDGELLTLGNISIKVLHTPGHTMESSTFLVINEEGEEKAIFTGDTLFIGDVGRPDLAVSTHLTQEDLAGHLYDSLRNKIMTLPGEVIIYPGHGAGSACGKNMSKETTDTLRRQKLYNYALRADMTRDEFIKEVTTGLAKPPQYFPANAILNRMGYESIDEVLGRGIVNLDVAAFKTLAEDEKTLVLDTRESSEYLRAHIPGSWWIGINDNFAPWVGALIHDLTTPILFVADEGREQEVVTRLARVGYDNAIGYLEGGMKAWQAADYQRETIKSVGPHEFVGLYDTEQLNLLDVRKVSEYASQHVKGAQNFPLDSLQDDYYQLNKDKRYYLHCQGGYRSVIAASILKALGFDNVINIEGGFNEIKKSCVKLTKYQEPVSML